MKIGPRLVGEGRLTWKALGYPSVWLARLDCSSSLFPLSSTHNDTYA
jgi:hypothetical protein